MKVFVRWNMDVPQQKDGTYDKQHTQESFGISLSGFTLPYAPRIVGQRQISQCSPKKFLSCQQLRYLNLKLECIRDYLFPCPKIVRTSTKPNKKILSLSRNLNQQLILGHLTAVLAEYQKVCQESRIQLSRSTVFAISVLSCFYLIICK